MREGVLCNELEGDTDRKNILSCSNKQKAKGLVEKENKICVV